jgi:putative transcriptional regulator
MTAATPRHHVPRALLADYVAGNTNEAVSLVVACHLTLCSACSSELAQLERAAGAQLAAAPATAVSSDLLARTLARLDEPPAPALDREPRTRIDEAELPRPLLRWLDRLPAAPGRTAPRWKRLVPGIDEIRLPVQTPGATVRLLRLMPKATVPLHGHEGDELIAVFSGGIEDAGEVYERDVELRGAADEHVQTIRPGPPCVAVVVNHGALLPRTWAGRLFKLITRA